MTMPRRSRCLSAALPLLLALAAPLAAQNGDKAGETQHPIDASIKVPPSPILKPDEERATFRLPAGFHAELIAADPLLGDPISIIFGPDGRLWVLEMRGYMLDADATGEREPVCSVVYLEDTDGDGVYDKRTVFADKLVMPRAIALVGGGVLIGEPTHLWFYPEKNGVAGERKEIASDYGNTNNPEHNANGLMWAMDNWIYSANYTGRFRWQPGDTFQRDLTITRGQWGISQDDYGRIYHNSNSDPLRYDAVPSAYLKRNPNFAGNGANVQLVPATLKVTPSRVTTGINRGYKTLDTAGKEYAVTSACGPVVYRGSLFPAEFRGDGFIAEPSGNLVKRIKLTEKDGALVGANAYENDEFMTATDERFRPVNLFNGPDGALYVVDLYRGIIQHRIYMTSFLRDQVKSRDLEKGLHLGRIWRVVPDGAPKANFKQVALASASATELVAKLADPNGWVRDTAQRLLVERRDAGATAALAKLAVDAAQPALARLHALWTLDGVGAFSKALALQALNDTDAHVCAAAVRLSEKFLAPQVDAEVLARLVALTHDRTDAPVRLQLALSLGEAHSKDSDAAMRTLVVAAGRQPFMADAIVTGIAGREADFVAALATDPAAAARAGEVVRYATGATLKGGQAPQIDRVLALAGAPDTADWARTSILSGVRMFLPKSPDGRKTFPGNLPAEPKALVALAGNKSLPASATADQLLKQLKWPGKPGSAETAARPLTPAEEKLFDKGKAQFATLCATCHQPNGQGLAGLAPPLVYSRWVLGDPRILARIVLCGKVQENLVMPPWRAALDDETIAGTLTFIRRSWGHDADPVTIATVAEARKDTAKREEPWSDADLEDLVQALSPVPAASAKKR